jgi:hypothetical protein
LLGFHSITSSAHAKLAHIAERHGAGPAEEAIQRKASGETLASIAKRYAVDISMISWLTTSAREIKFGCSGRLQQTKRIGA